MEQSEHEKLDDILKLLQQSPHSSNKLYNVLDWTKNNRFKLSMYLDKLKRDDLVTKNIPKKEELSKEEIEIRKAMGIEDEDESPVYTITFEGELFIEQNGYLGKINRAFISKVLQSLQIWLTAIGAFGILVFEILKWYQEKFPCCSCHHK